MKGDKRRLGVVEEYGAALTGGKNFKHIDEQLQTKKVIELGSEVYIQKGRNAGLYGKVVEERDSDRGTELIVELFVNDSKIRVKKRKVILATEREREQKDQRKRTVSERSGTEEPDGGNCKR